MGQPTSADAAKFCGTHGPADVGSEPGLKRSLSGLGDNQKHNFQPEKNNSGEHCSRAGDSSEQEVTCFRVQGQLGTTGNTALEPGAAMERRDMVTNWAQLSTGGMLYLN